MDYLHLNKEWVMSILADVKNQIIDVDSVAAEVLARAAVDRKQAEIGELNKMIKRITN